MKKPFVGFTVWFFVCIVSVFSQVIDKTQYKAIDPFDYKLDEEKAARGAVRQFKSVVRFTSQSGTDFLFSSLDHGTSLQFNANIQVPSAGQTITIYYTAIKGGIADTLVLDEIDTSNTTEAGIGVVKSAIPASSGIRKSDYIEIDPLGFNMEEADVEQGEERKYKTTVLFSAQSGTLFFFKGHNDEDEGSEWVDFTLKVGRRFPPLVPDQKVTIYYTARKEARYLLSLDDIEF